MSSNQSGGPLKDELVNRRPVGLDRDERLHQLGPRIGDQPAIGARLRMRQHDRGTDLVEQRGRGVAVDLLRLLAVDQRRKLRRVERIEIFVAGLAAARPLGVALRLRPQAGTLGRGEAPLGAGEVGDADRPLRHREVRRASARHLVGDIDGVAAAQEILRPAFAAVRRAGEVGSGLPVAVDHHHRVGAAQPLRNPEFRVHLADHRRAFDRSGRSCRRRRGSRSAR